PPPRCARPGQTRRAHPSAVAARAPRRSSPARSRIELPRRRSLAAALFGAIVLALRPQQLLVEVQPLVVQRVPHALSLRAQVVLVVLVGRVLDRDLRADGEP